MKRLRQVAGLILAAVMVSLMIISASAQERQEPGAFTYNQVQYSVGMDAKTAQSTLGAAVASRDVNNCANGYINKAYTYGDTKDFEILIEQNEKGQELISNITLLTSKVSTGEGLRVDDPESRIQQIYPTAKKGLSSYTVFLGVHSLYIKTTDGKVSFISYI